MKNIIILLSFIIPLNVIAEENSRESIMLTFECKQILLNLNSDLGEFSGTALRILVDVSSIHTDFLGIQNNSTLSSQYQVDIEKKFEDIELKSNENINNLQNLSKKIKECLEGIKLFNKRSKK